MHLRCVPVAGREGAQRRSRVLAVLPPRRRYPALAALLQAAMAQPDRPHATVPYADVGDRFAVSRTHVRELLVAAEEAGLVRLHARGRHRVEILPRLWSSHDRGLAEGMYLQDMIYVAATRRRLAVASWRGATLPTAEPARRGSPST
jgi:hypothetical protein